MGCFKDQYPRAMTQSLGSRTIEECYAQAKMKGYAIFGIQNGNECRGEGPDDQHDKYGEASNCNNGQGGGWANSVYKIGKLQDFSLQKMLYKNRIPRCQ